MNAMCSVESFVHFANNLSFSVGIGGIMIIRASDMVFF
jgi:hypothetical protein